MRRTMYNVPVRDPDRLTDAELKLIAEHLLDNDDAENEVECKSDLEDQMECEGNQNDINDRISFSEHDSRSDQSVSDLEAQDNNCHERCDDMPTDVADSCVVDGPKYFGKDKKTVWYKHPLTKKFAKTSSRNIVKIFPRPTVTGIESEESAFMKFFTCDMIEDIVKCTNIFIQTTQEKFSRERDAQQTSIEEFLAFLGLLFLCGVRKQSHTSFEELWINDGTGSEIFRATMSSKRFLFLLRTIRFDDKATRQMRCETDKLAPIRDILDKFVTNCRTNYCLGEFITIDEMLVPFRGRCGFIQYIPNKPAKYGLKIFAVCDSKTFYVGNLEIYCGKQPTGPYMKDNTPTDIVHRLVQPYKGKNRNLTCDNWYTNYPLALSLLKDKVTLVGTLKKNKREIPPELLPQKIRPVNSSIFAFQRDVTMVSYSPKKNKCVILLSTMHSEDCVDSVSQKPEIILFYNSTKGGIDSVDQMCANYTVSKRTRRWPFSIFFQLLNIAGINANVLYNAVHVENMKNRRLFLKNLSLSLLKPHLSLRAKIPNLPLNIKHFLLTHYNSNTTEESGNISEVQERGRCVLCGRKKNRVTTIKCSSCLRMACKEHVETVHTCKECLHPTSE